MAKSTELSTPRSKKNGSFRATTKSLLGAKQDTVRIRKDAQHVVGHDGGWVVRSSRTGRFVTRTYPLKDQAIDAGRRIARKSGGELLVHGRSGQIFQHTSVPSTISEAVVRKAIRAENKKSIATKSRRSVRVKSKKNARASKKKQ